MKKWLCTVLLLGVLLTPSLTASAAGTDVPDLGMEAVEEGVPESAKELMEGADLSPSLDAGETLRGVLRNAAGYLKDIVRRAAGEAVVVLAAAMLCAAASSMEPGGKSAELINFAGVFAIGAATVNGVGSLVELATETMGDLSAFSKLLLPALCSASAASGAVSASAARYAVAALFLDVLVTLGERVVLPVIYMFLACSIASAAFGGLGGVAALLGKAVRLSLTAITIAFTVFLTVSGLIASAADATAVRITRTALAAAVPIVGGMAADATDAVVSGVALLRNAAGAFGAVTVVAVCAMPFLRLSVRSVLFRLSAALAETVADRRLSGLIGSVSACYSMVLGLTGTCALMLFISIVSVTGAVTGV